MKAFTTVVVGALLASGIAIANERAASPGGMMGGNMQGMMNMMRQMQAMDANRDGLLSKEEFTKAHDAMFDAMPKNKDGLVEMKDMAMCPMMGTQQSAR